VHPSASLDDVEERKFLTLPGFELRPLGRPARSQSIYRLRLSGSQNSGVKHICLNIVTSRPIASERVGKHVSMEMDSCKATRSRAM
jgi:hypothetical protein